MVSFMPSKTCSISMCTSSASSVFARRLFCTWSSSRSILRRSALCRASCAVRWPSCASSWSRTSAVRSSSACFRSKSALSSFLSRVSWVLAFRHSESWTVSALFCRTAASKFALVSLYLFSTSPPDRPSSFSWASARSSTSCWCLATSARSSSQSLARASRLFRSFRYFADQSERFWSYSFFRHTTPLPMAGTLLTELPGSRGGGALSSGASCCPEGANRADRWPPM
mmetsp:Transcript_76788/g.201488  ORF Transcript_76788/g.201488 Transcript_76788/m.201488 type:complete len:227 (+) Transcript_76788:80-760(+)